MATGIIDVVISRDAPGTPWGFRLHGGKDIGFPLVIQRVFMGSPSDGSLHRGDSILQIQGRDSTDMTHMDAHDLIKAASTRLQLLIRRLPGAPQTPTSPLPTSDGMHPYAKLLRETEASNYAPAFQPLSPPRMTPRSTPVPPKVSFCSSPLPTTPVLGPPLGGLFVQTPRNQADRELLEYRQEKYKEKDAMSNQGYRTLPLIAPGPKTRHDIPMGSYLRHVPGSDWKGRSSIQPSLPKFYNSFPTPTYSTIGRCSGRRAAPPAQHPGAPTFEQTLDENSQLVHHQYNSPMFLYSQRNINQTIQEQTGHNVTKPKLTVNTPSPAAGQSGPLSPGTLVPARPGTKLTNIVDITLSPTFQMIQEAENRSGSPLPPSDASHTLPRRAPGPKSPQIVEERVFNPYGIPKEVIHQSGSFKTLMSSLYAPIEQEA